MKISEKKKEEFVSEVLSFYKKHKRDLPWRPKRGREVTPYHIVVSEFMLQQTSVPRVLEKYKEFLGRFPTWHALAGAEQKDVLSVWVGLGYNRRALYLKKVAEIIVSKYKGVLPKTLEELKDLPGIGEYMSAALLAFVYNKKVFLIETNVRTVYMYHFFEREERVRDSEIQEVAEIVTPEKNTRDWYYALMDYGTYLKKEKKIKNSQSAHYVKQKKFVGSRRFVRGGIVKLLIQKPVSFRELLNSFPSYKEEVVMSVCEDLKKEEIIKEKKGFFFLA